MPSFSSLSLFKLQTCHEDLIVLFSEVVKNFDCTITEGYRSQTAQEAAFNAGNSTLHYPYGKHNSKPSNAVDVYPYPVEMKNIARFHWFAGYVIGTADRLFIEGKIKHRIKWGGDWDRDYDITDEKGLRDLVHFELVK